ncbi:MAG: hypothetical protein HRT55_03550 [Colwellia sp.]|uniref:hypothetical protein n=1 Tax=Colwellia sp. TaxID=56799 RepID=UPI0025C04395|nr:hypothetical protein [Colwellia sp.]NQZ25372.1 hypothetical protein [Colwellia sp.]
MNIELFTNLYNELLSNLSSVQVSRIHSLVAVSYKQTVRVQSYQDETLAKAFIELNESNDYHLLQTYKKLLIIGSILKNWPDLSAQSKGRLSVEYQVYLQRIYHLFINELDDSFDNMDIFWKELAVARLQLFPLRAGVAEFYSGFGIRQGLTFNLIETIRFIAYLLQSDFVRKAYYKVHTHTPTISNFSEDGWTKSYLQLAEMLKRDKTIKGVIRGSWFFDPEIKKISPHLSYLQDLPLQHGAKLFYIGSDKSGCAFSKSKARLKLYHDGKYTPKNYLLVWPREAIIHWADSKIK